ncbi:hypothetical protein K1719_045147 [Acacia pycnantha]|nr:hypothetical protein K1719_045147 [Acacia pycnantha]
MRPFDSSNPSYVARIEQIKADSRGGNVKVHVQWYYRPEESIGGRRQFHDSKEMPYNPDDLMVQCGNSSDWFHPACIDMTVEEAKGLEH